MGGPHPYIKFARRRVLVDDRGLLIDDDHAARRFVQDLERVERLERSAAGRHRRAATSGSHAAPSASARKR